MERERSPAVTIIVVLIVTIGVCFVSFTSHQSQEDASAARSQGALNADEIADQCRQRTEAAINANKRIRHIRAAFRVVGQDLTPLDRAALAQEIQGIALALAPDCTIQGNP